MNFKNRPFRKSSAAILLRGKHIHIILISYCLPPDTLKAACGNDTKACHFCGKQSNMKITREVTKRGKQEQDATRTTSMNRVNDYHFGERGFLKKKAFLKQHIVCMHIPHIYKWCGYSRDGQGQICFLRLEESNGDIWCLCIICLIYK